MSGLNMFYETLILSVIVIGLLVLLSSYACCCLLLAVKRPTAKDFDHVTLKDFLCKKQGAGGYCEIVL